MRKYTHLRLSWYLPLPELITHKNWFKKEALWLGQIEGNIQRLKRDFILIPNVGKLAFETDYCYPIIKKHEQLSTLVDFDFSPIFYAKINQIRTNFDIKQISDQDIELKENICSLAFNVKCFPAGFIVFNAYINYRGWLSQPINHKFINKLICGKKLTSIIKFINFLKAKTLVALFGEKRIQEIRTILTGPKIRVNLIDDDCDVKQFQNKSKLLLSLNVVNKINIIKNKTGDYFHFNKKGIVVFTSTKITPKKRQYFRHNIDLIMDIVYGIESILPILPKFITQIDQKDKFEVERLIFTFAYTLNPDVLNAIMELNSILPTAGTRKWFSLLAKEVKLYEKYSQYRNLINERVDELRIDRWYKIMAVFLLENIPGFTSPLIQKLIKQDQTIKDIIDPKVELDKEDDAIVNWFIDKFYRDLVERFTLPANDMIIEDEIGYSTLFQVEKHFKIQGREHMNFKSKIDVLNAVGLLESKPYKGPGAKKGSKKYRANPKHRYIASKLKINLTDSIISQIKLRSV
ncbi:MAG: hypothetical protein ACTSUC_09285 [Promethearchaeota archaeon]